MPEIEFKVKACWSLYDDAGNFILYREADLQPEFTRKDHRDIKTYGNEILNQYVDRQRDPDQWAALIHTRIADENMRKWVSSVIWYDFAEGDNARRDKWEMFWEEECLPAPVTDEEYPSPRLFEALHSIGIQTDAKTAGMKAKKALTRRKIQMKLRSKQCTHKQTS